jgi:hypothetical protein
MSRQENLPFRIGLQSIAGNRARNVGHENNDTTALEVGLHSLAINQKNVFCHTEYKLQA